MRLTTWNVNGIRNPFSYQPWNTARTFPAMFDILGSDIVVMQELKIQRKDLRDDMVLLDGWDCYFSLPKHKKGYSGVGIYTRNATCAPIRAEEGLLGVLPSPSGVNYRDLPPEDGIGGYPSEKQIFELGVDPVALDAEGRCLMLEFPAFVLLGVYSPANSNGLRDDFRYGFICALDCRIRNLARAGKNVVLVGDLNVSRGVIDVAGSADDIRKSGLTEDEYISSPNRRIFNQLLIGGEVVGDRDEGRESGVLWDTTRGFHPKRIGMYTHWEQKINARPGNYGSRIDFVLVSQNMQDWIEDANIQEGLLGSDHCPVFADFKTKILTTDGDTYLLDIMNPAGSFVGGKRHREYKASTVPAFSAKRLPEFEKRRSIKSMFAAPATKVEKLTKVSEMSGTQDRSLPAKTAQDSTAMQDSSAEASVSSPPERRPSTSPVKRRQASTTTTKDKPSKRQKLDKQPSFSNGQQSLKGFFRTHSKSEVVEDLTLLEERVCDTAEDQQSDRNGVREQQLTSEGTTLHERSLDSLNGTNSLCPLNKDHKGSKGAGKEQNNSDQVSKPSRSHKEPQTSLSVQTSPGSTSGDGRYQDEVQDWATLESDTVKEHPTDRPPLPSPLSSRLAEKSCRSRSSKSKEYDDEDNADSPKRAAEPKLLGGTQESKQETDHCGHDQDPEVERCDAASSAAASPNASRSQAAHTPLLNKSSRTSSPPSRTTISRQAAASDIPKRIHTSAQWSTLFTRPAAPLCEGHNESCKTMLTKKKGSNQGRSFWMCARPLGPSGQKEKGTEWRCGTFIWATDWKGG